MTKFIHKYKKYQYFYAFSNNQIMFKHVPCDVNLDQKQERDIIFIY